MQNAAEVAHGAKPLALTELGSSQGNILKLPESEAPRIHATAQDLPPVAVSSPLHAPESSHTDTIHRQATDAANDDFAVPPPISSQAGGHGGLPPDGLDPQLVRYLDLLRNEIAHYTRPELGPLLHGVRDLKATADEAVDGTQRRPDYRPAIRRLKTVMDDPAVIDRGLAECSKTYAFNSFVTNVLLSPLPAIIPAAMSEPIGAVGDLIFQGGIVAGTPLVNTISHLFTHTTSELEHNGMSSIKADDKSLGVKTLADATTDLETAKTAAEQARRTGIDIDGAEARLATAIEVHTKSRVAAEINHASQFWQGNVKLFRLAVNITASVLAFWYTPKVGAITQGGGALLTFAMQLAASKRDHINRHDKQLETLLLVMKPEDWDDPAKVTKYLTGPLKARCKAAADYLKSTAMQLEQNIAEMNGYRNKPEQNVHAALQARVGLNEAEQATYDALKDIARDADQDTTFAALEAKRTRTTAENKQFGDINKSVNKRKRDFDEERQVKRKGFIHRTFNAGTRLTAWAALGVGEGIGKGSSAMQRYSRTGSSHLGGRIGKGALGMAAFALGGIDSVFKLAGHFADGMTNFMTDEALDQNQAMLATLKADIAILEGLAGDAEAVHPNAARLSGFGRDVLLTFMKTLEERTPGRLGPLSGFQIRPNTLKVSAQSGLAKAKNPPELVRMTDSKTSSSFAYWVGGYGMTQLASAGTKVVFKYSGIDHVFDHAGKLITEHGVHTRAARIVFGSVQGFVGAVGVLACYSFPYNANWKVAVGKRLRDKYEASKLAIPVSARAPFTIAAMKQTFSDSFAIRMRWNKLGRESGAYQTVYGMWDTFVRSPRTERRAKKLHTRMVQARLQQQA